MKPQFVEGYSWNEPAPIDHAGFHNRCVDFAVKRFNDKEADEILLGYFVFTGGGHVAIFHCPWDSEAEKYAVGGAVRRMLKEGEGLINAYSFITEAWAVRQLGKPSMTKVRPSGHPDREDVLMITTLMRDGASMMTRFGVKTYPNPVPWLPPTKKSRLLERDDNFMEPGMGMVGSMYNFFQSKEEANKAWEEVEREEKEREAKQKGKANED